jgi:hypothetical protein
MLLSAPRRVPSSPGWTMQEDQVVETGARSAAVSPSMRAGRSEGRSHNVHNPGSRGFAHAGTLGAGGTGDRRNVAVGDHYLARRR